ncbi:hypothetical protein Tco_0810725, partial [Tanacetum coccineum]
MESQSETTQTLSALKLSILKTRDYDLWSMRMEHYLTHTDYVLWEVIVNGDAPVIALASAGTEGPIPPKTAEQKLARKNELKAKSTLLLAIPDDHLLKFHGIKDAKTLWEAIKARFGGNKESKKMQKTNLKKQYENFVASRSEGLDKTYDRFQKLISQLEIHGEVVSQEDANLEVDINKKTENQAKMTKLSMEWKKLSIGSIVMSSASSAVTYTSVYTDSEPGRVFWAADEEISDGGSLRVIVYGYDGLPMQPVAPSSPDYIPGPVDPQTPPVPQDEDELESPGYVTKSDPKEDQKEYEDDETEDGPVDYPIDGKGDKDDEDEEEEEHLAPADSAVVVPTVELV